MGVIGKTWAWLTNASYDDTTPMDWFAGLVLLLLLAFLWSTVVNHTIQVSE